MFWYSHLAVAIGAASFLTVEPLFLGFAGFIGLVPDMDRFIGHRHWFSHSLLSTLLLSAVAFFASGSSLFFTGLVFVSLASHTFIDFFTKSGVPILHPINKTHHGLRLFSAHNRAANKAFIIVSLLILLFNLLRGQGFLY